jgi:hypothetical protein
MHPEYDKLNDIIKETRDDVIIARLEGSINEDITLIYDIFSFPKIVLYHPGSVDIKGSFKGQRIAQVMQSWIEKNAPRIEKKLKYLDEVKPNNKKENIQDNENIKNVKRENETKINTYEQFNNRNKPEKDKSLDHENNPDAKKNIFNVDSRFTFEVEFLKNEMMNIKNGIINVEKDIQELKDLTTKNIETFKLNSKIENEKNTKKLDAKIKNYLQEDKENSLDKEDLINENNTPEEVALKLKMIKDKKKKGEGFFDKITKFNAMIYLGIILFLVGSVITIKKILFKNGKGFFSSEHIKI